MRDGSGNVHSQCVGKDSYRTPAEAARVKKALSNRGGKHKASSRAVSIYRCPHCSFWHLGRDKVMRNLKALRRDAARLFRG